MRSSIPAQVISRLGQQRVDPGDGVVIGPPSGIHAFAGHRFYGARSWWLLLATCVLSFALFSARIDEGFIGADDGTLSHAAERVLHGERPQVDFYDNYTGALSYVDAFGLKLFGMRMLSLRWMLFLFFAAWVPATWYLASRFASPPGASLITLLAVLWSTPIYPAPVASWYNLYFATFGTAALFRYIEDRRAVWTFLAGISAGVSFLFKITGLYFFAAIVLFLVFDEQSSEPAPECDSRPGWPYFGLIVLALCGFDCMLWGLIRSRASAASFYNFLLPVLVLSGLLVARAWQSRHGAGWLRLRRLGTQLLVLSSGFLAPVLLYLLPYLHAHALGRWFYGVLVIPTGRLQCTFYPSIDPVAAICCVPLVTVLLLSSRSEAVFIGRIAFVPLSGVAVAVLFLCVRYPGFALGVGFGGGIHTCDRHRGSNQVVARNSPAGDGIAPHAAAGCNHAVQHHSVPVFRPHVLLLCRAALDIGLRGAQRHRRDSSGCSSDGPGCHLLFAFRGAHSPAQPDLPPRYVTSYHAGESVHLATGFGHER